MHMQSFDTRVEHTNASTRSNLPGEPVRVLALVGSLRRDSYNRRLVTAARNLAPTGLEIAIDQRIGDLPLFSEDLEEPLGALKGPVVALRQDVSRADGLLIATPEYNRSIPGVLKNAIDWLSCGPAPVLSGKPVAILGASTGPWGTRLAQAAAREIMTATEAIVLPAPAMFLRNASSSFGADGQLTDDRSREVLERLLEAFGAWIRLTTKQR